MERFVSRTACLLFSIFLLNFGATGIFAQDSSDSADSVEENAESDSPEALKARYSKAGESEVPAQKRPRTGDAEKIRDLDNTDPDGREKNADILKYGLEDEILELLSSMKERGDVRFSAEAYDLYEESKSPAVKESVMDFFASVDDPCLEDYAVMIANDPFDEGVSTVNSALSYLGRMGTAAAVPAVEKLLEGDDDRFYDAALGCLGKIGGGDEAMYLTYYMQTEDLTLAQRQTLVKTLGALKASPTYDSLVEMAQNEDENSFIRMYACEAVGQIAASDSSKRDDGIAVLSDLFEDKDPNLRAYVVRGISNFSGKEAEDVVIQALKDRHVKVRLEAVEAARKMKLESAVPYLVYRAKKDPEAAVKKACYPVIAELNTGEGNEYLVSQITAKKKVGDDTKAKVAAALLESGHAGSSEIIALADEALSDDHRKPLRYSLGKEFAKRGGAEFEEICSRYMDSKDVSTQGIALDIYAKARYPSLTPKVQSLADLADPDAKTRNANAFKAAKILGIKVESKDGSQDSKDRKAGVNVTVETDAK